MHRVFLAFALLLPAPALLRAQGLELSGSLVVVGRWFPQGPRVPGQLETAQPSVFSNPSFAWESEGRRHLTRVSPFFRLDGQDDQRSHVDLREAYWRLVAGDWELLAGINRVFWGVTESRHLVNVINQDDTLEDVDEEDKLGQPMVQLALQRDWGRFEAFALIGFRKRSFPGPEGRVRPALPIDGDAALFESSAGRRHVDLAFRYSHFIGDWDIGLSGFYGTSREPLLRPDAEGERLIPFYQLMRQASIDVQYTRGAWLWKLEALVRGGQGPAFGAVVVGFEHSFYQLGGGAADLGVLLEYQRDGRDPAEAPATIYDDDVFVGARLALNDAQDTSILAGAIVDTHEGSVVAFVEAERRLGQRLKLELESRLFLGADAGSLLASFSRDSFVLARVGWYF